jgi:mannitol/fructose-specific phosphotransferase system IIA component
MTTRTEGLIVQMLPPQSYPSTRAVIEAIGEAMVSASAVMPAYVDGMLRKEQEASTIVTPEVALPHGTADVRSAVLRNALVIAPIPDGVEWAPGRHVRLAIGFAGTGDDAHMRLLAAVARVLSDDQRLNRLKSAGHDMAPLAAWFDDAGK